MVCDPRVASFVTYTEEAARYSCPDVESALAETSFGREVQVSAARHPATTLARTPHCLVCYAANPQLEIEIEIDA